MLPIFLNGNITEIVYNTDYLVFLIELTEVKFVGHRVPTDISIRDMVIELYKKRLNRVIRTMERAIGMLRVSLSDQIRN